jgi:hypothetical protein
MQLITSKLAIGILISTILAFSCIKKISEPIDIINWEKGNISSDRRLGDTVYFEGIIKVINGAKLTIDPGTTIIFKSAPLSALVIEAGCRIEANGTKDMPITFTSDEQKEGSWGGVIILGQAPVVTADPNLPGDAFLIEGFDYGGDFPNDNSGRLNYVRIWYAGGRPNNNGLQSASAFNGLTLCGVGNGTIIDFVHIHKSGKDAFAIYGGTVSLRHVIATSSKDDGLYSNEAWNGDVQFYIAQMTNRTVGNGIEIDNNRNIGDFSNLWLDESNQCFPFRGPDFVNITIIGDDLERDAPNHGISLLQGGHGSFVNVIILGFEGSKPLSIEAPGITTYYYFHHSQIQVKNPTSYELDIASTGEDEFNIFLDQFNLGNELSSYQIKEPFHKSMPDFSAINTINGATITYDNNCPNDFFAAGGPYRFKGAIGNNDPNVVQTADWTKGWTAYP